MPKILVSYRREDSRADAGRLYDRLRQRFRNDVFLDIDSIKPGDDFHESLIASVAACDCLLAVIGKTWLTAKDANGKRRLDKADDFVRIEVGAALDRGIRVVPVLVGGASMLAAEDLPGDLVALARRQAIEITDTRFNDDVALLISAGGPTTVETVGCIAEGVDWVDRARAGRRRQLMVVEFPKTVASKGPSGWLASLLFCAEES